jgi:uncharacterized SAM-binding protein YcdF (DUF218 family)
MIAAGRQPLVFRAVRLILNIAAIAVVTFLLFLPFAGRFLDVQQPLEKADLIFVLAGARIERWLEAVDLYKEGWASKIVMSPGPSEPIEGQLRERGVKYPRDGDLARDAAVAMGVPADAIAVLPDAVDNTAHEAAMLQRLLAGGQLRRVIVVTSPYHTRRTGFAFRRQFANTGVQVIVRGSRHSAVPPSRWWRRREEIRLVMNELPKLAAYLSGLGE